MMAVAFMASLTCATGHLRAADGYLLELLAWIAYGDHDFEVN